ncbi:lycopene cyclase domain-containing protein [Jatrophihabitans telluris]|uniref:Lycopene cyclase domain-containing protein n=1 Tax=Jatrophihabitans telluris TaxID=2038343 RepID=A0ABY4QW75_9ACTN|nr:lycopene cyclase domain-containing protein [Jatrophihabitans telluris]UQX87219.1 lycopene cyclase domain-containing protein [Jatrophihabitans telluris]
MRHLTYLGLLAACLVGTAPLEILLRTQVYSRPRRLLLALLPGLLLGTAWDLYAVHAGHWSFADGYLIGLRLAGLPVEEILFFAVIPLCAVLTLEAVRRRRPDWLIGDEPSADNSSNGSDGMTRR